LANRCRSTSSLSRPCGDRQQFTSDNRTQVQTAVRPRRRRQRRTDKLAACRKKRLTFYREPFANWWARRDLNPGPKDYESSELMTWQHSGENNNITIKHLLVAVYCQVLPRKVRQCAKNVPRQLRICKLSRRERTGCISSCNHPGTLWSAPSAIRIAGAATHRQ